MKKKTYLIVAAIFISSSASASDWTFGVAPQAALLLPFDLMEHYYVPGGGLEFSGGRKLNISQNGSAFLVPEASIEFLYFPHGGPNPDITSYLFSVGYKFLFEGPISFSPFFRAGVRVIGSPTAVNSSNPQEITYEILSRPSVKVGLEGTYSLSEWGRVGLVFGYSYGTVHHLMLHSASIGVIYAM
jgi:hypothetical protein